MTIKRVYTFEEVDWHTVKGLAKFAIEAADDTRTPQQRTTSQARAATLARVILVRIEEIERGIR